MDASQSCSARMSSARDGSCLLCEALLELECAAVVDDGVSLEEGKRGGRLVVEAELRSERRVAAIPHPLQVAAHLPSESGTACRG